MRPIFRRAPGGGSPALCLPIALALSLALTSCVTLPVPSRRGDPLPSAEPARQSYDYAPLPLRARIRSTEPRDGFRLLRLELTAPQAPGFDPIAADWYRPDRPGRHPAVLISPILAGNDLYVKEFARHFAARGLHAVIVYRQKEIFSADRRLDDVEEHLRRSVIRLRQALDWLESEESVDGKRIGTFAISLGAMLTAVLAAVEPRVRASVLGLPAGDIPGILMTSRDKAIRKRRANYLRENNLTEEEALVQLKKVIRSEPLDFASRVPPDRALMICGLFDRVVGFRRSLALWNRMGRPRLILLPTGHYSAVLATPYLKIAAYSFLRRRLSLPAE